MTERETPRVTAEEIDALSSELTITHMAEYGYLATIPS